MGELSALVVTTPAAAGTMTNGATLRADEVVKLLEDTGYRVTRTTTASLAGAPARADLAVAVSYACAGAVADLRRRAPRVWLDAVDSWLLVNSSGLRSGRPSYALRALRDGGRLMRMPPADLLTYISGADLNADRGSVRARRRLVLPGSTTPPTPTPNRLPSRDGRRIVLTGDWAYPPNRDGLAWFVKDVLPRVEEQRPASDWKVVVYGRGPSGGGGRIRLAGYAQSPGDLYREGDVHAAPVRFGAGVKRKVLLPLLAGLPVVTTPAGAHGLRSHPLLAVRQRPEGFAAALAVALAADGPPSPARGVDLRDRDDTGAVIDWLRR
jgi:hypothetical protein